MPRIYNVEYSGIAVLVLALIASGAAAQVAPTDSEQRQRSYTDLIDELGSEDFRKREAATRALIKSGRRAMSDLSSAAQRSDPEVAGRAVDILFRFVKSNDAATSRDAVAALAAIAATAKNGGAAEAAARGLEAIEFEQRFGAQLRLEREVLVLKQLGALIGRDRDRRVTGAVVTLGKNHAECLKRLAQFPDLRSLRLGRPGNPHIPVDDLDDEAVTLLVAFPELTQLDVWGTPITDAVLRELSSLRKLKSLDLGGCRQITDRGLSQLTHMQDLEFLDLGSCEKVTDEGLKQLQELPKLATLILDRTGVTDEGVERLAKFRSLSRVDFIGTAVTREGARRLSLALPRCQVRRQTDAAIVLAQETEMQFERISLRQALAFFSELHRTEFLLDEPALKEAGIDPEHVITEKRRRITLSEALEILLEPLNLTYTIENDIFTIRPAQ